MRVEHIEEASDLLFRLPRIMRTSLHREIFGPALMSIDKNLAPHHMAIMKVISEEGMLHISEIGDRVTISKAQMTHSVDKLTSLGMIERIPDAGDRRKICVRLTEKGKAAVREFEKALKKRMMERLSWLQDEELTKMLDALNYLVVTFEKLR